MTCPTQLHFNATDAQIAAIRAKLGIAADVTSARYDTKQASLYFHTAPGGFDVDVLELHGMAKFATEPRVRAHIAEQIGLEA